MSQSRNTTAEYRMNEDDWFRAADGHPGHGDDETEDINQKYVDNGQGEEWGVHHSFCPGKSKEEVVAHKMLREMAPLLCSTTLFDPPDRGFGHLFAWLFDDECLDHDPDAMHHENKEVELSDPQLHVPKRVPDGFSGHDYGQFRHRARLNDETGYVSGAASTSVVIQDVSEKDFLRVVDVYLSTKHLPPKRETEIRQFATSAKRDGNDRDVDILERVIWMVEQQTGGNA